MLPFFANLFDNKLLYQFQTREIIMPIVSERAFLTRELLPDILEFIEVYDYPTQERMLDIVVAKNPRIREFFQLYFNHQFEVLGDVDYAMPKSNVPAESNIYRQLREIQTLTTKFVWTIEKKRNQYKIIASSLSVEELMVLENVLSHTLEEMYPQLNWDYLKTKWQIGYTVSETSLEAPEIISADEGIKTETEVVVEPPKKRGRKPKSETDGV